MSYKDQRKELGLPELGTQNLPINSTIDGSKWHHNVDSVGIAKLTKISGEISSIVDETSVTVAKAQIKVGRLLNEARALIPGDLQFGKWREQNTPITNKSTANKLMNLAKQVGEGRITQEMVDALPISTLKELISAPDTVVSVIREQIKEDPQQVPTRQEVRDMGKAEREPSMLDDIKRTDDDPAPVEVKAEAAPAPKPVSKPVVTPGRVNPAQVCQQILDMTVVERLRHLDPKGQPPYDACKPEEWAWLVLGLDPMPAYLPNTGTVQFIVNGMNAAIELQSDYENLEATVGRAAAIVMEVITI